MREELERWDSEASMNRGETSPSGSRAPTAKSSRGSPSRASQASAGSARMHVRVYLFCESQNSISPKLSPYISFNIAYENLQEHPTDISW